MEAYTKKNDKCDRYKTDQSQYVTEDKCGSLWEKEHEERKPYTQSEKKKATERDARGFVFGDRRGGTESEQWPGRDRHREDEER